jgi:cytochrome P450
MRAPEDLPALPFDRPGVLHLPPEFMVLQAKERVTRVRTPAGDPAWLVTRYDDVRELFASPKLGRGHADPANAPRFSEAEALGAPNRGDSATEAADHARRRTAMAPWFSPRRMERLRPHVETMVERLLGDLAAGPPRADFHERFSYPLPAQAICLLLGVPWEDRDVFRQWADDAVDLTDRNRAMTAITQLGAYMKEVVEQKRRDPGEDVISDLIAESEKQGRVAEHEVVATAVGLLYAGHGTTASLIDFGVLLLLTHPGQRDTLRSDPSLSGRAVEEILRASAPSPWGVLPRYAHEQVEIDGQVIPAGDMVLLSMEAANLDGAAFHDPWRFDITRQPNPHLLFGHGPRFCIGAALARIELQATFGQLFSRLPGLRLDVPLEDLRIRQDRVSGGLVKLPVTW